MPHEHGAVEPGVDGCANRGGHVLGVAPRQQGGATMAGEVEISTCCSGSRARSAAMAGSHIRWSKQPLEQDQRRAVVEAAVVRVGGAYEPADLAELAVPTLPIGCPV